MNKMKRFLSRAVLSAPVAFTAIAACTAQANINESQDYIEQTNKNYYEIYAKPYCDNNDRLSKSIFRDGLKYDDIYVTADGYPKAGKYEIHTSFLGDKMLKGIYDRNTKKVNNPILYVQAENCSMFNRYARNKAVDNFGNEYEVSHVSSVQSPYAGQEMYQEVVEVKLNDKILRKHQKDGLVITLKTFIDDSSDGLDGKLTQDVFVDGAFIKRFLNTTNRDVSEIN